jgi:hypothetical protein
MLAASPLTLVSMGFTGCLGSVLRFNLFLFLLILFLSFVSYITCGLLAGLDTGLVEFALLMVFFLTFHKILVGLILFFLPLVPNLVSFTRFLFVQ